MSSSQNVGQRPRAQANEPAPSFVPLVVKSSKQATRIMKLERLHLNGQDVTVAEVAVAARNEHVQFYQDEETKEQVSKSVRILNDHLEKGDTIYGVTTGFGGSADTRTNNLEGLQKALVHHQQSGILTVHDKRTPYILLDCYGIDAETQAMPSAWVRAAMIVRINSLVRGHSGVRQEVIDTLIKLLNNAITPVVPIRGTISASGDLAPMSYIVGALQGQRNIHVRHKGAVKTAKLALEQVGIKPIQLQAKEGLGLLNGTPFSTGTACLVHYDVQQIATFTEILTAMGLEAIQGNAESFYPEIAAMRPHPGQADAARTTLNFLRPSRLARGMKADSETEAAGLFQDRYTFRTASQWIGPQLEELYSIQNQLKIEVNSTTDNPLIDPETEKIFHGGNFQAQSVTTCMDKTRVCLERFGKLLFAQCTEIINPAMNNGLPPNLSFDDPSLSFTCKGLDIAVASYCSELGVIANPVSSHVQSAEMHNQAINSLALISTRQTLTAVDLMYMIIASYIFVVCQALDLRVLQIIFYDQFEEKIKALHHDQYWSIFHMAEQKDRDALTSVVTKQVRVLWPGTSTMDLKERCEKVAAAIAPHFMEACCKYTGDKALNLEELSKYKARLSNLLQTTYDTQRGIMVHCCTSITGAYLGDASERVYSFVRKELHIPLHCGLDRHDTMWAEGMIGEEVSKIYDALKDGRSRECVVECLNAAEGYIERKPEF